MKTPADLELGLHRRDVSGYAVDLRFSHPDSEAEVRASATLDALDGDAVSPQATEAGASLGQRLFASGEVRSAFDRARAAAAALEVPLRIRLVVGPSAPELHRLPWEALHLPDAAGPIATSEMTLFSRYLASQDWRQVHLRPRDALRVLVVIANPTGLDKWRPGGTPLAPVDSAGELARARAALGEVAVESLATSGQATLGRMVAELRSGYDVLYLVCHGAFVGGEPKLWLEDDAGNVAVTGGGDLVKRLGELKEVPRLVVLASCQSAGAEGSAQDGGALAALGPRLAEVGIPAVIGMQGNVSMITVARIMPVFFRELMRDGAVDRAMAAARAEARDRPDWWMPVLFMRLKSGRIWYAPGFSGDEASLDKWPALVRNVEAKRCTPLLGPGCSEAVFGSRAALARSWAERYGYPAALGQIDSLPSVAQYLAVDQDDNFPRDELKRCMRERLVERLGADLPADLDRARADVGQLVVHVGRKDRERDPTDPYRVLADLDLPLYLTCETHDLLAEAVRARGGSPQVEICRWNADLTSIPSVYDREPDFRPDSARPLIYHLFGHCSEASSMVLTEDDHFDFLVGVTAEKDAIPTVVRRALADSALLFLGFQMDDWPFRVLFRSIMSQEGRGRRRRYAHIAAQVDPDEARLADPERARRFLEEYFSGADISIYWGGPTDFVKEMKKALSAGQAPPT